MLALQHFVSPEVFQGPGGFRKVREADRIHFLHISSNSDLMVPSFDQESEKVDDWKATTISLWADNSVGFVHLSFFCSVLFYVVGFWTFPSISPTFLWRFASLGCRSLMNTLEVELSDTLFMLCFVHFLGQVFDQAFWTKQSSVNFYPGREMQRTALPERRETNTRIRTWIQQPIRSISVRYRHCICFFLTDVLIN